MSSSLLYGSSAAPLSYRHPSQPAAGTYNSMSLPSPMCSPRQLPGPFWASGYTASCMCSGTAVGRSTNGRDAAKIAAASRREPRAVPGHPERATPGSPLPASPARTAVATPRQAGHKIAGAQPPEPGGAHRQPCSAALPGRPMACRASRPAPVMARNITVQCRLHSAQRSQRFWKLVKRSASVAAAQNAAAKPNTMGATRDSAAWS